MRRFLKYLLWFFCLVLIFVSLVVAINVYVIKYSQRYILDNTDNINDIDAVLILGARVYSSGHVSLMLADRLETGLKVYGKHEIKLIVSGGEGDDGYNEVDAMERYLKSRYVAQDDIIKDFEGKNTFASIRFIRMQQDIDSIIISTQKYHLYRSIFIARKKGIEAYGIAADMHKYPGMSYYRSREAIARVKDFILLVFSS